SDFLAANTDNPAGRQFAIAVLARRNTPEGWAAIGLAAQSDPDEEVKKAAEDALRQNDAKVAGILITFVDAESQAALAGIKVGDILTNYNGKAITTIASLNEEKQNVAEGQTVQVMLYRGGEQITLPMGPGMIGINGVAVKPKEEGQ
ncbi:MAG: PDZ domain-containing protein, partial [Nitrospira sp.]|nr:PDZ domain-containing protein [Nitrospira sp.]